MATYASTTNPFIEPGGSEMASIGGGKSGDRQMSKETRKCTPGMARPKKYSDEFNKDLAKRERSNLLLEDEIAQAEKRENILNLLDVNDSGQGSEMTSDPSDMSAKSTSANESIPVADVSEMQPQDHDDDNDAAVIDETCLGLVEQAARLNLSSPPSPDGGTGEYPKLASQTCPEDQATTKKRQDDVKPSVLFPEVESSTRSERTKDLRDLMPGGASKKNGDGGHDDDDDDDDADDLLIELNGEKHKISSTTYNTDRPPLDLGGRQHQHIELIKKLRLQLRDLERYAYERGELEQVPPSILAERQSVILDKLRKRLSLNLDRDKIEKLELEELKRQVDEEINNLIDPLVTKEHLLNQLKTQLTDLERYISHLHGSISKGSNDKSGDCSCSLHGCSSSLPSSASSSASSTYSHSSTTNDLNRSIITSETLPKTSRLIRGLMAQLICSDIKIQEAMKLEGELEREKQSPSSSACKVDVVRKNHKQKISKDGLNTTSTTTTKVPQFHDGAAWTLHIDRIILATDSLTNLFSLTPKKQQQQQKTGESVCSDESQYQPVDSSLVESVVRRQLISATRDLLSYGLIDPSSMPPRSSYVSFLVDPYYLLTSFSCLPGLQLRPDNNERQTSLPIDKVHIWDIIVDYYESKNEVNFRTSSVKTLSQSFNLTPSMDGPIKITSKQALLIAIDDILCRLAKRKPNGPESHFKLFVYIALNQGKLATWIKLVFKNKSILKKYYHDFSFVNQSEKMDKFLATIETLSQLKFNIDIDADFTDQFVSAF